MPWAGRPPGKPGPPTIPGRLVYRIYPEQLVAGAWIGYDIEKSLGTHETGAVAALPIWLEFMKEAVADIR